MTTAIQDAQNYSDWIYAAVRPHLGAQRKRWRSARATATSPSAPSPDGKGVPRHRRGRRDHHSAARAGPRWARTVLAIGDAGTPEWEKRFRDAGIDTVVMLNVVEHLENDKALLEAAGRCAPKGKLVVMVPAHQFLYGTLRSPRPATIGAITALRFPLWCAPAGWNLREIFYMNGVGAFAWFMSARALKLKLDGEGANNSVHFYDRFVVPWARVIDPCITWLCGPVRRRGRRPELIVRPSTDRVRTQSVVAKV